MKILIIEDEIAAANRLKNMLNEINPSIELLGVLDSIEDSVSWLTNNALPELIFMDIKLSDGLCFEIFEDMKLDVPIVFTTAYDEFMQKAFQVNGIDYILKPIKKKDIEASLKKFQSIGQYFSGLNYPALRPEVMRNYPELNYKSRFLIKSGQKQIIINVEAISYFYIHNHSVFLITKNLKKILVDLSLDALEELLNPRKFFRVNRTFLVNIDSIESFQTVFGGKIKLRLQPEIKDEVLISRKKVQKFKEWITKVC